PVATHPSHDAAQPGRPLSRILAAGMSAGLAPDVTPVLDPGAQRGLTMDGPRTCLRTNCPSVAGSIRFGWALSRTTVGMRRTWARRVPTKVAIVMTPSSV